MEKVYKNYIRSRENNNSSSLERIAYLKEKNAIENYIEQKQDIKDVAMFEIRHREEIKKLAEEILDALDLDNKD